MAILAPSILSSDMSKMSEAVHLMEKAGISIIHLDIMDGRFVPPITFGAPVVKGLRKNTSLLLDTHLMVVEPEDQVEQFIDAGADYITIHIETTNHPNRILTRIKESGLKAGIALNPATPLNTLTEPILDTVDFILIMSVNPGYGGQSYIPSSTKKIENLKEIITEGNYQIDIAVDGGIDRNNIEEVSKAGATIIVVGSAIFASPDPVKEAMYIRSLIEN
ncbi:MAG: ribulose-phosphate 3-epimerase [Candidatus Coatesbacteria bacterium]|nr:MAG: ribulose-phosphate 3-epimerase [Candidatus Coatesbacteria bacterium]